MIRVISIQISFYFLRIKAPHDALVKSLRVSQDYALHGPSYFKGNTVHQGKNLQARGDLSWNNNRIRDLHAALEKAMRSI